MYFAAAQTIFSQTIILGLVKVFCNVLTFRLYYILAKCLAWQKFLSYCSLLLLCLSLFSLLLETLVLSANAATAACHIGKFADPTPGLASPPYNDA